MVAGLTDVVDRLFELLDRGNGEQYVEERLFGDRFESLERHTARKAALGNTTRYGILYLMYEYGELSRSRLSDEIGRSSNYLEQPLKRLIDTNLIEKIPGPPEADGRKTYYQITTLGKQEIAADLETLQLPGSDNRYQCLVDPALDPDADPESDRRRAIIDIEELSELRKNSQQAHELYKDAAPEL